MTTFDERERAFENLFVHDEEARFRVLARRDKALAQWVCGRIGASGDLASSYRDEILAFALAGRDDAALAQRLADDLTKAGHAVTISDVRDEMQRQEAAALAEERKA